MNTLTSITFTALVVATLTLTGASSVHAQTHVAAPHMDPDVSQLNGAPVKVGEHHEYRYSYKRTNISANPIGAMFGIYSVSLSRALNHRFALRGDFTLADLGDVSGMELGVSLPIYFKKMYSGFFLEPGIVLRSTENDYDDGVDSIAGPQVLVGWHWSWDSGLNVSAAVGAGRNFKKDGDYRVGAFPNGYFRIGYMF